MSYNDNRTLVSIEKQDKTKIIHFMGYGYYAGEPADKPYRWVEYTGLECLLKEALETGIENWEQTHQEEVTQYSEDITEAEFNYIMSGHKEKSVEKITANIPYGTYFINYEKKEKTMNTNNKQSEIVYIPTDKLYPHPNNPRKDLGDLTELIESIKAQGILQNLTVVPREGDTYTIIIGHRRHAAAKEANCTVLPCVISDMDEQTQVSTMLLENMQRSDLTVIEQAKGIQLAMDLGLSKAEISKKTGLSKVTIGRRLELLKYDEKETVSAIDRGATLLDFMELSKIKDEKEREKLFSSLGTNNFKYRLAEALQSQERAENFKEFETKLAKFAKKVDKSDGLRYVRCYCSNPTDFSVPDDADKTEYFFKVSSYSIDLYRRPTADEIKASQEENRQHAERERRRQQLNELAETAYILRVDFIKSVSNSEAKKHAEDIMAFAAKVLISEDVTWYRTINVEDTDNAQPAKLLLLAAYARTSDSKTCSFANWNGSYAQNVFLENTYELMIKLGYQMSDEEQAWRDGTHELFIREED